VTTVDIHEDQGC